VKVRGEGDARQFTFEVGGVALAVFGMVEERIDVAEDVFFREKVVGVVPPELCEGGVFEMGEWKTPALPRPKPLAGDAIRMSEEKGVWLWAVTQIALVPTGIDGHW